tara:strand:- start:358 stop:792 length:435 start_codon:yes stop_codon:yes gene_type:complete
MVEINLLKLNFDDNEFSHIRYIRETVFTNELGISKQELFDKNDETCDHFLIFDGKEIAGSVRIISMEKVVKLERMAILKDFRTKHYGKNCIFHLKEYYSVYGVSHIILDSIYSVRGFYKKCGFIEKGDVFQRVGIDHIRMSLTL